MKKNAGLRNNNNINNNKRLSLLQKVKKSDNELTSNKNLKENQLKSEDNIKYNHINKSIDNKNVRNKDNNNSILQKKKKMKKLSNKASLSQLKELDYSVDQNDNMNKSYKNIKKFNFNKNNSVIITNIENLYNENNYEKNAILDEQNQNMDSTKYKNSSYCNIRVNKPTKLILDPNITINDLAIDKPMQANNKFTSATHRKKKEINKTFNNNTENNLNFQNFKFNNNLKPKNPILKENIIKTKLKENCDINKIKGNMFLENINTIGNNLKKNNLKHLNSFNTQSVNRFNTSNNFSFKRDNSNSNDLSKVRMKSIDNVNKINLCKRIKKKNLKLNTNQIYENINSNNGRLLSPNNINLENFKKHFFNEASNDIINNNENITVMNDISHMDLLKLSMNELFLEKNKLIEEINNLKIEKQNNLDIKQLQEKIKSLLKTLDENESKLKDYEDIQQKNDE